MTLSKQKLADIMDKIGYNDIISIKDNTIMRGSYNLSEDGDSIGWEILFRG